VTGASGASGGIVVPPDPRSPCIAIVWQLGGGEGEPTVDDPDPGDSPRDGLMAMIPS
jgi:hypothetical protein